jgi:probable HAF family extracellular repeat protein
MSSINTVSPACPVTKRRNLIPPRLLAGLAITAAATITFSAQAQSQAHAAGDHPATTLYRVVNLGAGQISELPVINVRNQVSFSLFTEQGSRGFFYDGKGVRDIGTLGGASANAVGLNDAGQVVGRADTGVGANHAFVWSAGTGMTDLGVLPGASASAGFAINNEGVVAGYSDGVPATPPLAFRWSAADGMRGLGAFTSGLASFSVATALNDAGLIAGNSDTSSSDTHSFAWTQAAGMMDIDSFRSDYSAPAAVARDGRIAGYYAVPGSANLNHAFMWSAANGMRDLGTAGGVESYVLAMSPNANIAGVVNLASGDQHAMAWTDAGGMIDLGTLDGAPLGAQRRRQVRTVRLDRRRRHGRIEHPLAQRTRRAGAGGRPGDLRRRCHRRRQQRRHGAVAAVLRQQGHARAGTGGGRRPGRRRRAARRRRPLCR